MGQHIRESDQIRRTPVHHSVRPHPRNSYEVNRNKRSQRAGATLLARLKAGRSRTDERNQLGVSNGMGGISGGAGDSLALNNLNDPMLASTTTNSPTTNGAAGDPPATPLPGVLPLLAG